MKVQGFEINPFKKEFYTEVIAKPFWVECIVFTVFFVAGIWLGRITG